MHGTDVLQVYRTQIEPEFIYISSAGVPPITDANYDGVIEVRFPSSAELSWGLDDTR